MMRIQAKSLRFGFRQLKKTQEFEYENAEQIAGLTYIPDFITQNEQQELLNYVDSEDRWGLEISSRRTQQYGYRYDYITEQISGKTTPIPDEFSSVVQRVRMYFEPEPVTQMIINEYAGDTQGIGKHIDCPVFGPVVASLSLIDPCVMIFHEMKREEHTNNEELIQNVCDVKQMTPTGRKAMIVLQPRSLLILKGDARYKWKHEVPKRVDYQKYSLDRSDFPIQRSEFRRVSLTFRSIESL